MKVFFLEEKGKKANAEQISLRHRVVLFKTNSGLGLNLARLFIERLAYFAQECNLLAKKPKTLAGKYSSSFQKEVECYFNSSNSLTQQKNVLRHLGVCLD